MFALICFIPIHLNLFTSLSTCSSIYLYISLSISRFIHIILNNLIIYLPNYLSLTLLTSFPIFSLPISLISRSIYVFIHITIYISFHSYHSQSLHYIFIYISLHIILNLKPMISLSSLS